MIDQKVTESGWNGKKLRVMFEDESRFGRISDPRKCWAPKGIRPIVGMQIVHEYTYVFSAVSPVDGLLDSLILPEVNTEAMSLFLDEISKRHTNESIIMFMDGAGWHRSGGLRIPENIGIIYLPPYSPELNPVEHLWEEIREKWFTNLVFKNIKSVEDKLMDALIVLENDQERVFGITSFDWIISAFKTAT